MATIRATVKPHWLNGWVLRPLARPYIVVDGVETETSWGRAEQLDVPESGVALGAGVRYFGRGELMGYEPQTISPGSDDHVETVVLRNGFWNHTPFRIS